MRAHVSQRRDFEGPFPCSPTAGLGARTSPPARHSTAKRPMNTLLNAIKSGSGFANGHGVGGSHITLASSMAEAGQDAKKCNLAT